MSESDLNSRAERLVGRVATLAKLSTEPRGCTRLAFSSQLAAAVELLRDWLAAAGFRCRVDAASNLSALARGRDPSLPRLILGSHLDTVSNGGAWDGTLGVLVAADCVERLARAGLPARDLEVVVFADEEGVRFGTGCFGSRALAGAVADSELALTDGEGVTLREALDGFGGDHRGLSSTARDPSGIGAFLEVHIEQGPVLERLREPLALVSAIAGNSRSEVRFEGVAGHAGTVPMEHRSDALAAAAAWAAAVEERVSDEPELVATVGRLSADPGQVNVIAGSASASLDVRSPDDARRRRLVNQLRACAEREAARRGGTVAWTETLDRAGAGMDQRLITAAQAALRRRGLDPPLLTSGAGHDAAVMASICPTAMLMVRCRDGLSHHRDEHVSPEDVRAALEATDALLEDWLARWPLTT